MDSCSYFQYPFSSSRGELQPDDTDEQQRREEHPPRRRGLLENNDPDYHCAERADAVTKSGQDYADIEGLCYKMDFNYQMAKHPDPYTEAAGYNGPVFIARAADDKLVDDACCQSYKKVYRCAEVMTLERGGHNFAAIPTREALNHALAEFIKSNI